MPTGQPRPRALSPLGDSIISPVSGCGCEQQSDTAIPWGIKAQFHFRVISLSLDADAVVALKTKVVWFFFFYSRCSFHINAIEAAEEELPQFDLCKLLVFSLHGQFCQCT